MMVMLLSSVVALAESPRVQLRTGVEQVIQSSATDLPAGLTFCGELRIVGPISMAACGNGSGILHQREMADVAHFRLQGMSSALERGTWLGHAYVGGGIMEVQRGQDAPGFRFGAGVEGQVEAAGPELSMGLRLQRRDRPLLMDVTGGVAHIPGAVAVLDTETTVLPSVGITIGLGYSAGQDRNRPSDRW